MAALTLSALVPVAARAAASSKAAGAARARPSHHVATRGLGLGVNTGRQQSGSYTLGGNTGHRSSQSQPLTVLRAQAADDFNQLPDGADKVVRGWGFDTSEGIFGYTPFAELWAGRLAMMGFTSGFAVELVTGDGILQQIGIPSPNPLFTVFLLLWFVGGPAAGAAKALQKAQNGEMSYAMFQKYVKFLGADTDELAAKASIDLKRMPGFFSPDDLAAIRAAKATGTAADRFLTMDEKKAVELDMPDVTGRLPDIEGKEWANTELLFAKEVEMTNGRWAMIGFSAAVLLESITGYGIIGQLIIYAQATGVLGEDSGIYLPQKY
eukprot:CAMPEP_0197611044 /NCGR_PEP_ID=MMETSP1326-20131121/54603_1 /TAXON_ID=1155430 /ORGANISM="Genus nov. species nov., Strain RCC2288" /LENGTH=322 /DNA_ID=CAMNT_0043179637 /DNA_START=41 /DNA_END=1009 /DNA_ORIENTATION=+